MELTERTEGYIEVVDIAGKQAGFATGRARDIGLWITRRC
jgi:hypothetical protein